MTCGEGERKSNKLGTLLSDEPGLKSWFVSQGSLPKMNGFTGQRFHAAQDDGVLVFNPSHFLHRHIARAAGLLST